MRRWLKAGVVVVVLGGCLWGLVSYQQQKARREADAWLEAFRHKRQDLVPGEARALAGLAERSYAERRLLLSQQWWGTPWPTHTYLGDPVFLITRWRLGDIRRFAKDLGRSECIALWARSDFGASICTLPWVDLETNPEKALSWLRILSAVDDSYNDGSAYWRERARLDRFQLIAERLPSRRAEIENAYVWPILLEQQERGELPNFVDYLSPETRRPHAEFIAEALIVAARSKAGLSSVAQQTLLLDSVIGDAIGTRITEILLQGKKIDFPLPTIRRNQMGLLARLLNRYEVSAAFPELWGAVQQHAKAVYDRDQAENLEAFLAELDGPHLNAICETVRETWLADETKPNAAAWERAVNRCVDTWGVDDLRAVLVTAAKLHREAGHHRWFSLTALLAALLTQLGNAAPAAALSIVHTDLDIFDDDRPWRLAHIAEAVAKVEPVTSGHALAGKIALLLADEPIDTVSRVGEIRSLLRDLCGVIEGAPRNELAQALRQRLLEDHIDYRFYPRTACLAALRPGSQVLADLQPILVAAVDNAQDEWMRNWAMLSLVTLAQNDDSTSRRAQALETALANIRNLPHPRCDLLTRLVPEGDLPTFAHILRLPTCSSYERRLMVGQLAERHGLTIEAFARPFVNVSLDIGYKADPVRVALWLDERGL